MDSHLAQGNNSINRGLFMGNNGISTNYLFLLNGSLEIRHVASRLKQLFISSGQGQRWWYPKPYMDQPILSQLYCDRS